VRESGRGCFEVRPCFDAGELLARFLLREGNGFIYYFLDAASA
jgi:hypothetical protein